MSVRLAQAAIPHTGAAVHAPKAEPKREQEKPGASKASSGGGSAAKSVASGKSGGAQGARQQEGAENGAQLGAHTGGADSLADTHEPQARSRFSVIQGEGAHSTPQAQEQAARPAPRLATAPELPQEHKAEGREGSGSRQEVLEGRARLRAALLERLAQGMADVEERLSQFLKAPGKLGVVNLSLVLSESSITYELWQEPSTVPERRARMALTLGLSAEVEDASLLRTLMAEVHEAFIAFRASSSGRESLQRYEQVLRGYEAAKVLPVVPGHDTGPMLAELARVGLTHEADFSRSLLVNPLLLAVGLTAEEGSETQVMIAGLSVAQLGTLVAQLRQVNPRLTNHQVCRLLLRATTEPKKTLRKCLGQAELERVLESAYQLLRLQVFELFFV